MAQPRTVEPVVRFCALISGQQNASEIAIQHLQRVWGAIVDRSEPVPFDEGGFYRAAMGGGLTKTLLVFEDFSDPADLADWKIQTNRMEQDIAALSSDASRQNASDVSGQHAHTHCPTRPVNIDPGYISQAKLVLATIKDRDHRVYLRDGIFGEVTLNYTGGDWISHRWSYPSYQQQEVIALVKRCRLRLRQHLRQTGGFRTA